MVHVKAQAHKPILRKPDIYTMYTYTIHALGATGEMTRTLHSRRSNTWHKMCVVCVHKSFASFVKYRLDGAQRKRENVCRRTMLNVYFVRMLDMKMTA